MPTKEKGHGFAGLRAALLDGDLTTGVWYTKLALGAKAEAIAQEGLPAMGRYGSDWAFLPLGRFRLFATRFPPPRGTES